MILGHQVSQQSVIDAGGLSGVSLTSNGLLTIAAGNNAGDYTISYEACGKRKKRACGTGTVYVSLTGGSEPLTLSAQNDSLQLFSDEAGSAPLLANDFVDDELATPASISIALTDDGGLDAVINEAGELQLIPGALEGVYDLSYIICDLSDTSNCDSANITVSIVNDIFKTEDGLFIDSNYASARLGTVFELSARSISSYGFNDLVWTSNDGQEKSGANVNFEFSAAGAYTINVSGTSSQGAPVSEDISLIVYEQDGSLPGITTASLIGDINLDGIISQADIALIEQIDTDEIVTELSFEAELNADIDLDGEITQDDALILADMLASAESFPTTMFPEVAAPLSVVTLVSPELLDLEGKFQVQFGNSEDLYDLAIISPGYANFVVPFDFAGPDTNGEIGGDFTVYLHKDNVSIESFDLEILPATRAPNARDALAGFFIENDTTNTEFIEAVADLYITNGVSQKEADVFLAPFRSAAADIAEANIEFLSTLETLSDEEVDVVFQAYVANGLEYDEGLPPGGPITLKKEPSTLNTKAGEEDCDTIKQLCDVKRLAIASNLGQRTSNYACAATSASLRVLKLAKKFLPNGAAKKLLNDAADCAGAEARNSAMILLASYFKDFKFDIRLEERPPTNIGTRFGIDGFYELKGVEQVCGLSNGGSGNIAQNFADRAFANYKRTSVILKAIAFFEEDRTLVETLRKIVLEKGEAAINETITELDYDSFLNKASDAVCKENGEIEFESNLGLSFKFSSDKGGEVVPFVDGRVDIACLNSTIEGEFDLEISRSSCLIFPKRKRTIGPYSCYVPPL